MILEQWYEREDLFHVKMLLISSNGKIQLGRSTSITDPQWIETIEGDDVALMNEEQVLEELQLFVTVMAAPEDEQPCSGDWKKFFCGPLFC